VARPRPHLVSVIVPARDAASTIAWQLVALAAQDVEVPWEVVVVDNGSLDGTIGTVDRQPSRVPRRVVRADARHGPGYARNVGARAAAGDLLVFCDADDLVADGWLHALVAASRDADAVVGALDFERLNRPHLLGSLGAPRPVGVPADEAGTAPRFGIALNGGNFAVWRSAFDAVGGFEESFRGGSEDKDLGYRLTAAGFQLVVEPNATVHVRLRAGFRARVRQAYGRGREDVHLAVRHAAAGYPRRGLLAGVRTLAGLVRDVARLGRSVERVWWWTRLGRLAGRAVGCVRYRAIAL
jgi:glycosyltransferase involved in cell wall biosynthesis